MVSRNRKTKKCGEKLKIKQRVQYSIIENFSSTNKSDSSDYRQLLISEIEMMVIHDFQIGKENLEWDKKQCISSKKRLSKTKLI